MHASPSEVAVVVTREPVLRSCPVEGGEVPGSVPRGRSEGGSGRMLAADSSLPGQVHPPTATRNRRHVGVAGACRERGVTSPAIELVLICCRPAVDNGVSRWTATIVSVGAPNLPAERCGRGRRTDQVEGDDGASGGSSMSARPGKWCRRDSRSFFSSRRAMRSLERFIRNARAAMNPLNMTTSPTVTPSVSTRRILGSWDEGEA